MQKLTENDGRLAMEDELVHLRKKRVKVRHEFCKIVNVRIPVCEEIELKKYANGVSGLTRKFMIKTPKQDGDGSKEQTIENETRPFVYLLIEKDGESQCECTIAARDSFDAHEAGHRFLTFKK